MMLGRTRWLAVSLAYVAQASWAQTRPSPQPPAETLENADIVVTASKVAEPLSRTPGTVTALDGATLERQGINQFSDYVAQVPGLSTQSGGAAGLGQVIIRGITTGAQQTSPTVGYYIDETPVTASGPLGLGALVTADPDLADIARIEVLKGPQSTLYGASALGGLVKVVTTAPDLQSVAGEVRLSGSAVDGGNASGSARGVLNVPLDRDRLGLRVSGFYRRDPGYTDNVRLGRGNVNGSDTYGARATLRFAPSEEIDLRLTGVIQDIDNDDLGNVDTDSRLRPLYGRNAFRAAIAQPSRIRYRLANATVNAELGFATLTSSTSYSSTRNSLLADNTYSYGAFLPFDGVAFSSRIDADKFTQELRLASPANQHIEWLAGLFYTHESDLYRQNLTGLSGPSLAPIAEASGNIYTTDITSRYREIAGFANVTLYLTPQWDIAAGIRYADNRQRYAAPRSGLLCGACTLRSGRSSEDATTYQFTTRWRPDEHVNLFARAASAYRPGGPTISTPAPGVPTSFRSDTLWNYEIGAKTRWLNGRLAFDISGFYVDWRRIQLNAVVNGFVVTGNGGRAESKGFEAEARYRSGRLTLGANIGYNDARLKSVSAGVSAVTGARVGDRLPFTPDWTAALNADYAAPIARDWSLVVGGSVVHQGVKVTSFTGDPTNIVVNIPSYDTLGLRAGVQSSRFEVMIRADNVTNAFGVLSAINAQLDPSQNLPYQATIIRPRTVSLTATARF